MLLFLHILHLFKRSISFGQQVNRTEKKTYFNTVELQYFFNIFLFSFCLDTQLPIYPHTTIWF